jgi:hypothetical protein
MHFLELALFSLVIAAKALADPLEVSVTPITDHVPPFWPTTTLLAARKEEPVFRQKRGSDDKCTPGDRACHASLDKVLFCNHNKEWVTYSECDQGTFCHRLCMTCVTEITPTISAQAQPTEFREVDVDSDKCKEGDRRCNGSFNRVDRCNEDQEWVTYHDCRKSETCNDRVLECLPLGAGDILEPPYSFTSP